VSKHWLPPEEYRALSPGERRALHFQRSLARQEQRCRPTPARYRKGYYARRRWTWLAIVTGFGFAVTQMNFPLPFPSALGPHTAPVTASFGTCKWGGGTNCVVDGDTFYLNGEKVRIAGIDAPETHDYGCASELALGDEATEKLQALLNSGTVTMTSIDRDRDKYGRLLRNVAVDGADVGEAMVSAGVAREYGGGRRRWC
jgi:endonuclease YncB( thermonuclease family)